MIMDKLKVKNGTELINRQIQKELHLTRLIGKFEHLILDA